MRPPPRNRLSSDRRWRLAMTLTKQELWKSVERRRTISLPNLLRVYQRRVAELVGVGPLVRMKMRVGMARLRGWYLKGQPFEEHGGTR